MKHFISIKLAFTILVITFLASCAKTDNPTPVNELEGLQLTTTIANTQHKIELYTSNGKFQTGYNAIYFQIKNADGSLTNATTLSWTAMMKMNTSSHSCPYSTITKKENSSSTYQGYIVFQMAGNNVEYWELTINYEINGTSYSAKAKINVVEAPSHLVETFQGSDNNYYVLAMVAPSAPVVGINDMIAILYQMNASMNYIQADGYTIKIDPRMPSMGNHSSPNNVNLTEGTDGMYHGKLSLTMTGYWKINLQVIDASASVIKGEAIADTTKSSSIYFDIEP